MFAELRGSAGRAHAYVDAAVTELELHDIASRRIDRCSTGHGCPARARPRINRRSGLPHLRRAIAIALLPALTAVALPGALALFSMAVRHNVRRTPYARAH